MDGVDRATIERTDQPCNNLRVLSCELLRRHKPKTIEARTIVRVPESVDLIALKPNRHDRGESASS